jgi:hypothetical protein
MKRQIRLRAILKAIDAALSDLREVETFTKEVELQNFIDSAGSYLSNATADIEYLINYLEKKNK